VRPRQAYLILYLSLTLLAASAAAAAFAASTAHTIKASSGGVTAVLSYRHDSAPAALIPYRDMRLAIGGGGRSRYDRPVSALLCGRECWPASGVPGVPVLGVAALDPGRGPDVVVNLYSGGAHCCWITQVFSYRGSAYAVAQRDFGDPGAALRHLGGGWAFVSADDRFAYEFTSFAFSGLPVAIWRFHEGHFVDVTRAFPARVAADASRQYADYLANGRQGLGLGFIAAWAADEALLGKSGHAAKTLVSLAAAGQLRSGDGFARSGRAFIAQLAGFLAKTGYSH
jgi:hypothetical protein